MMTKPLNPDMPDEELRIALRTLLETREGRRVAYWIIFELCRLWQLSMPLELKHELAMHTARHEGMRSVGQTLMVKLQQLEPRAYLLMLEEHQRDTERRIVAEDVTP